MLIPSAHLNPTASVWPTAPVCVRKPKPHRTGESSSTHSFCKHTWVLRSRFEWRLPPPAAPCCPFPLLFLTEQPHTYVIPTAPKTTRTGCCPSRSSQVDPGRASRLPAAIAALQARPYLSVYLPVYLVWSSFVRTSPASRKPTKPDSNSTFAAIVTCLWLDLTIVFALPWPRPPPRSGLVLALPHLAFYPDLPLEPIFDFCFHLNCPSSRPVLPSFARCKSAVRVPPPSSPSCTNDLYVHAEERPRSPNRDDQTAAPSTPDCPRRPTHGTAPMRHAKVDSKR